MRSPRCCHQKPHWNPIVFEHMIYLRSLLAGLVALVSVVLLGIIVLIGWAMWTTHWFSDHGSGETVSYDIARPWIGIPLVMVVLLSFLAGFCWEFRRARRAHQV